jgi:transcriptional regulator with XRE-family HTH domain
MKNAEKHRDAAKKLGQRLSELAAEKGFTQKQLAELTEISETTISRIFNGEFPSKSEYLCCLASAVGYDVSFNFCG